MEYPTELTGQEIVGVYIHEPGALVSNFAIALTCLVIVISVGSVKYRRSKLWLLFVISIGIAASGGMISHGFPTHISPDQFFGVWWVKNCFVLSGNFFAAMAVFRLTAVRKKKIAILLAVKFVLLAALLFTTFNFLPAVVDLAFTYLVIIGITWGRTEEPGVGLLKRSFLIAVVSGLFYLFPFSLFNEWFTNKDAVHVFAIISLIIVSKAIRQMELR